MSQLVIYKEFPDAESADAFAAMLAENRIDSVTEAPQKGDSFTKLYGIQAPELMYKVKIKPEHVNAVNALVESMAEAEYKSLPEGHFLLTYTTEELQQMIACPEEWSRADYAMARYILKQKGITYTDAELAAIRNKRITQIEQPKKANTVFIVVGFLCAFAGGLIGLVMGWHLWLSHKTNPEGKDYFIYNRAGRRAGLLMFIISVIVILLSGLLAVELRMHPM